MKIGNYYTGLDEYRVIFDSMSFFYDGPGLDELIKAPLLVVTLGSQTIFPSNDTPSLEWFETIVPSQLMPGIGSFWEYSTPQLEVGAGPGLLSNSRYDLTNTVITHNAPEPATVGMMLIGAVTVLRRRRRARRREAGLPQWDC